MASHEVFIQRCIDLASNGKHAAAPNPMVGSVVVHNGKIIGEGYHKKYGTAHAEVNAIASVKDKSLLPSSTIYVSLEPCAHQGKTPPCSDLIIQHKIPKVVIACKDPFDAVDGKGIAKLEAAGCEVQVGILEQEAIHLNRRFFTFHQQQRPYITLKWAQTTDGFIDVTRDEITPVGVNWISNSLSKKTVHQWRSEEQAIMVGTNTARNDNPRLTVREAAGNSPVRIVIDRTLSLPSSLHLFDEEAPTLVYTEKEQENTNHNTYIELNFSNNILPQIMADLYQRNIQSILVEGGKQLLESFISANLWDEARILVGNRTFGEGLPAPTMAKKPLQTSAIGDNQLLIFNNDNV